MWIFTRMANCSTSLIHKIKSGNGFIISQCIDEEWKWIHSNQMNKEEADFEYKLALINCARQLQGKEITTTLGAGNWMHYV